MKVVIGVASYRGIAYAVNEFKYSLWETIKLLREKGHTVDICEHKNNCYVQMARNEIVKAFMDSGADVLLFVDDDISWEPKDALRLIESKDEVIGGVYPAKKEPEQYPAALSLTPEGHLVIRDDGAIHADGLPAGFLKVSRGVFETICRAYPQFIYFMDDKVYFDCFPQGVVNRKWYGEDYAFCNLCREIDIPLWVLPDMTLTHYHKGKAYTGNFHEFLKRQELAHAG